MSTVSIMANDPDPPPTSAGYRHRLRQQSVTLRYRAECPTNPDLPGMDAWLSRFLGIIPGAPRTIGKIPGNTPAGLAAEFIWRVMHIAAELLRAARVPVFDTGCIVDLQRAPGGSSSWQLVIGAVSLDHFPARIYPLALNEAQRALAEIAAMPNDAARSETLLAALNARFVVPVLRGTLGGESTIPWLREAWAKSIPFRHLGQSTYQLGQGARQMRMTRGAIQSDSAIGSRIAQHKLRTASLLRDAGLPAPVHIPVRTRKEALQAAARLGWPVVIKPVDRDRGEGVTVSITAEEILNEAFERAAAMSRTVLVERQVRGVCHRLTVVQGRLRLVSQRLPKSVRGDGLLTVAGLVAQANAEEAMKPPWDRLKPFPLDELAIASLAGAGLTPQSIPQPGTLAPLRPIQSSEWGGVVEDYSASIHPANVAVAEKAARLLGLSVAGVDMISEDITRPWFENGATINEVNYSPLLAGPGMQKLIPAILDEWLPGGGRIPISAVVGGEPAFSAAQRLAASRTDERERYWITSHELTLDENGAPAFLTAKSLFDRCRALLVDPGVTGLIIVIQNNELLKSGLPVDRIDSVTIAGWNAESASSGGSGTQPAWLPAMQELLRDYVDPSKPGPSTAQDSM